MRRDQDSNIDHERFRANIVIDGMEPFQELELAKKKIKIGNTLFEVFKIHHDAKLQFILINQQLQILTVPQKLNEVYGHIDFGIYLKPTSSGQINLDDTISINK